MKKTTAKKTTTKKTKASTKGKQHPLHAESFDHIASAITTLGHLVDAQSLSAIFQAEAERVRTIVR